jgi:dihydroxy-acid dehydratase
VSASGKPSGAVFLDDSFAGMEARMFRRAGGLSAAAVRRRPVVGICSSFSELNPCNLSLRSLSAAVARGVLAAGGQPVEFPTISLSEPFTRPTSMLLRNLMAMDVEETISSAPIDAVVLLGGCDKTVPAQLMGALSAGRPAILLVAGPREPTRWRDRTLTIDHVWELADARRAGEIDDEAWSELEGLLVGGPGTCNALGTAATMAIVAEALGMSLPGTALLPATSAARAEAAERTGARAVELALERTPPNALVTEASLHTALRAVCATGGSTNAIIHLQALAGRAGVPLSLDVVRAAALSTPLLTDVRPSGGHELADLDVAGGVPALLAELAPLIDLQARSGDGRPWEDVVASAPEPERRGDVLRTLADPVSPVSGLTVLSGSLAPRGALLKSAAADPSLRRHRGPALVFDGVGDMRARVDDPALEVTPETVLVLRNAGPVGGPGMPEAGAIPIPERLLRAGVRDMVRVSDARMSGTARGTIALHAAPEAAAGGPLALVRDGDEIELDADAGTLDLCVDEATLDRRRRRWSPPPAPGRGYARLFHDHVLQADEGCDFDFLRAPSLASVDA